MIIREKHCDNDERTYNLNPIYAIEQYSNHTEAMPLLWVVSTNYLNHVSGHKPIDNMKYRSNNQFGYYSVRTHRSSAVQL